MVLPRSGVGVVPPWLLIGVKNQRAIRLDLRRRDEISVRPEYEPGQPEPFAFPLAPAQADPRCELHLRCGELEATLYIADGLDGMLGLVRDAMAIPRERGPVVDAVLFLGHLPVWVAEQTIHVGPSRLGLDSVRRSALAGETLSLEHGRLPAAMAMFPVAIVERDGAPRLPVDAESRYAGEYVIDEDRVVVSIGDALTAAIDGVPIALMYRGDDLFTIRSFDGSGSSCGSPTMRTGSRRRSSSSFPSTIIPRSPPRHAPDSWWDRGSPSSVWSPSCP
jgi:hypothetical protein